MSIFTSYSVRLPYVKPDTWQYLGASMLSPADFRLCMSCGASALCKCSSSSCFSDSKPSFGPEESSELETLCVGLVHQIFRAQYRVFRTRVLVFQLICLWWCFLLVCFLFFFSCFVANLSTIVLARVVWAYLEAFLCILSILWYL